MSRPVVYLVLGAIIIGTNALMARLSHTPPTVSAFWRMALACVVFAAVVQVKGGWRPMPLRVWWWLGIGGVVFAADLWMWHRSIALIGPGLATLLGNSQVFFLAVVGALIFRERLSVTFVTGLGLAFVGLWLLLGKNWELGAQGYRWGVALGLGTGAAYALYTIAVKNTVPAQDAPLTRSASVEQVLCFMAGATAVVLGVVAAVEGTSLVVTSPSSIGMLVLLAVVGHCVSWSLISRSVGGLPVAMVGLILLVQPTVAYLIDVIFFDQSTSAVQWAGLGLALTGIFVAGMRGPRTATTKPAKTR